LSSGFNVEGSAEFRPGTMPFALRADLYYNRWGFDDDIGADGNVSAFGGALNALFQMAGTAATPYVLVGPNVTNISVDIDDSDEPDIGTKFGIQGGVGVKFPLSGFTSKLEVRLTHVFSEDDDIEFPNAQWFTINFGILSGGR
jgi:opacity protein-like surface antigen